MVQLPQLQIFLEITNKAVKVQNGGSVYVSNSTSVPALFDGRLVYRKGALLLHTIRWKIGDAAFFQGIRNFMNDPLHAL